MIDSDLYDKGTERNNVDNAEDKNNSKENKKAKSKKTEEGLVISRLFKVSSSNALQSILQSSFIITAEDINNLQKNLDSLISVTILDSETVDSSKYVAAVYRAVSNESREDLRTSKLINSLSLFVKSLKITREVTEEYEKVHAKNPTDTTSKKVLGGVFSTSGNIFDAVSDGHLSYIKYSFSKTQSAEKNLLKTQKTIFDAKSCREKVTILAIYLKDINAHIGKVNETECLDETDTINKIESLKNKRKDICAKLTETIAKTATMHANLSASCKNEEDKILIKSLFDTGLNIKALPIDNKFLDVVKNVIGQINKDALMLDATKTLKSILNENKIDILTKGARTVLGWSCAKELFNTGIYFFGKSNPGTPLFKYTFAIRVLEATGTLTSDAIKFNKKLFDIEETTHKNSNEAMAKVYKFIRCYINMLSSKGELEKMYNEMIKGDALEAIKNADEIHETHNNFYNKVLDFYGTREELVSTYLEVLETVNLVDTKIDSSK